MDTDSFWKNVDQIESETVCAVVEYGCVPYKCISIRNNQSVSSCASGALGADYTDELYVDSTIDSQVATD